MNVITEMGRTEKAAKTRGQEGDAAVRPPHVRRTKRATSLKRLFSDCRRCKLFEKFRLCPSVSCCQTVVNLLAARSLAIVYIPTYAAIFTLQIQGVIRLT